MSSAKHFVSCTGFEYSSCTPVGFGADSAFGLRRDEAIAFDFEYVPFSITTTMQKLGLRNGDLIENLYLDLRHRRGLFEFRFRKPARI